MAKKSSGGISISSIIFLVVMYNVIFDDNDKNEVEIVEQDTIVQTEPTPNNRPKLKDTLNEVRDAVKSVGGQLKEEAEVAINDLKKELEGTPEKPKEDPPEEKQEELVAEPEKLKPLNDAKEKSTGMKKL